MNIEYTRRLATKKAYDVIIIGGGTAGVTAAIASARSGAETLLVERTGSLGGMMTTGNCGLTCYILHASNVDDQYIVEDMLAEDPAKAQVIGGIPLEITNRLIENGAAVATGGNAGSYVFTDQTEFKMLLNEMMVAAGVDVLFHTSFVDAVMEAKTVKGVVLHNKEGLVLYEAKTFIDTSGDGDLASAAGADYFLGIGKYDLVYEEDPSLLGQVGAMGVMYRIGSTDIVKALEYLKGRTEDPRFEVQIMSLQDYETVFDCIQQGQMTTFVINGLSFGGLQIYNTPDPSIFVLGCPCIRGNGIDPMDKSRAELEMTAMIDRWMEEIRTVPGFENSVVLDIPEIGVRETRHIIGDYILGLKEILQMHVFEDSIGKGSHLIDISPVPSWLKKDDLPEMFEFTIPYRSLIVKDVENMFVAGRCMSATHEASGTIRVTAQCMVSGEAAGTAAAMCSKNGGASRGVPYGDIRKKLLDNGVIYKGVGIMFDNALGSLYRMSNAKTRSICAENPTGEPGKGAMAEPNGEGAGSKLGKGWKIRPCIQVKPGETAVLADYTGSGIIRHIWMTADSRMSRGGVLRFYWDGEEQPSVEVPFADFFAMGHGKRYDVNSLPVVVNPNGGMNCYWPMPFRKGFKITFTNEYFEEVRGFFFQITFDETEVADDAAYFHAQWRRSMTTREYPEHVIVDGIKGKGQYVGTYMAWMQYSDCWWGEGEVKFYMDGDGEYPTICGTGTEDYFGGAWNFGGDYNETFGRNYSTPFLGFPYTEASDGKVPKHSLYRWHVMDPVRFEKDLKVTMQALGWWPGGKYQPLTEDIASVAYWYQTEPHVKFPDFPELDERWPR